MFLRDNKTTRIRTFGSRDNYFAQIAIKGDMIKKYQPRIAGRKDIKSEKYKM